MKGNKRDKFYSIVSCVLWWSYFLNDIVNLQKPTRMHPPELQNPSLPNFFSLWPPKPTIQTHWYHLCKTTQITFVSGQHFLSSQYLSYSWRWFPKCSSGSRDPRPWLAHPGSPPWIPPAEQWLWIISSSSPLTGCQPACVDGCTAQSPSKSCKTEGKLPKVVLQAWSLKIPEKTVTGNENLLCWVVTL